MIFKTIKTNATKVMEDMFRTNIVTFANAPTQMVEIVGENYGVYTATPFSCYNLEIVLDGEEVCINPRWYNGDCREIDLSNDETFEIDQLWVFHNERRVLLYNNTKGEYMGEITKLLDPRTQRERINDYLKEKGEI